MNRHDVAHYAIAAFMVGILVIVMLHLRTDDTAIDSIAAGQTHMGFAPSKP